MATLDIIATTELTCIRPTGERLDCRVEIGRPYRVQTGEWACHLSLGELYPSLPDISGEDSLQSLCLALSLARQLLTQFVEAGGRILCGPASQFPDGELPEDEFPIDAYFSRVGTSFNVP
jgi:hypothetical protein